MGWSTPMARMIEQVRAEQTMGGSYADMRGAIGSLIWLWVSIEKQAKADLALLDPGTAEKGRRGMTPLLDAWAASVMGKDNGIDLCTPLTRRLRERLKRPLQIRHGVCHGLDGLQAASDGRPGFLSWTLDGEKGSVKWDELEELFPWMSKVPGAMHILSRSQTEPRSRLVDTPENRDWWRDEYGIDFPAT